MTNIESKWSDECIGAWIAQILRYGVILSVGIVLFGGSIYLWHHGFQKFDHTKLSGDQMVLTNLTDVMSAVVCFDGRGIIQLGMLMLIGTPIARVAFSVFAFSKQKDGMYVLITSIVLIILGCGVLAN